MSPPTAAQTEWAVFLAAAAAVAAACGKWLFWPIARLAVWVIRNGDDLVRATRELMPNGGGSVKDRIDDIHATVQQEQGKNSAFRHDMRDQIATARAESATAMQIVGELLKTDRRASSRAAGDVVKAEEAQK